MMTITFKSLPLVVSLHGSDVFVAERKGVEGYIGTGNAAANDAQDDNAGQKSKTKGRK